MDNANILGTFSHVCMASAHISILCFGTEQHQGAMPQQCSSVHLQAAASASRAYHSPALHAARLAPPGRFGSDYWCMCVRERDFICLLSYSASLDFQFSSSFRPCHTQPSLAGQLGNNFGFLWIFSPPNKAPNKRGLLSTLASPKP